MLGRLCHRSRTQYLPLRQRLWQFINAVPTGREVIIPEIADYELRRKLLHLIAKNAIHPESLNHLDAVAEEFTYQPIDTDVMCLAAQLWCEARLKGFPTAQEASLDADVILAAQAKLANGTVVTTNRKHLSRFVPTIDWSEIPTSA